MFINRGISIKDKLEYKEIGQRLKETRLNKGLTQRKVYLETGIDCSLLSCYENGSKNIGLDNLIRLCNFYSVSSDFILFGEGSPSISFKKSSKNKYETISDNVTELFNLEVFEFRKDMASNSYYATFSSSSITNYLIKLYNMTDDLLDKNDKDSICNTYKKNLKQQLERDDIIEDDPLPF